MRRSRSCYIILATLALMAASAPAQPNDPGLDPDLQIELVRETEDGEDLLIATVTSDGEPVEDARVEFFVQRTFGEMTLGADTTFDDGTAAVLFPLELPGDENGNLAFVVVVTSGPNRLESRATIGLPGGIPRVVQDEPFPRALWAPRAPLGLILTFAILLGGVWLVYAYVFRQLILIRKEALS